MKKTSMICCAALFAASTPFTALAQEATSNPLTAGEKGFYSMVSKNVIAAAEKMPEENYSFKPTPDVRSFGEIVGHLAGAQHMFCSNISGEKGSMSEDAKGKTSKADLVQALKDSVAYCDKAYGGLTDAQATQIVNLMGHSVAKLTVMSVNTAHVDEHYGNMVTYLRLKGIVPPSSEGKK